MFVEMFVMRFLGNVYRLIRFYQVSGNVGGIICVYTAKIIMSSLCCGAQIARIPRILFYCSYCG